MRCALTPLPQVPVDSRARYLYTFFSNEQSGQYRSPLTRTACFVLL
jgi:hypothetical protein